MAEVIVRRSARRKRTVNAFWESGKIVVAIPDQFSARDEREWVSKMVAKLEAKSQRTLLSDEELQKRAQKLSEQYLEGKAQPKSVRWVSNQNTRWGSTTPSDGSIRISHRLEGMPQWVIDYVLLHELAHFMEANHGPKFWQLLEPYQRREEAKAFLAGVSYGVSRFSGGESPESSEDFPEFSLPSAKSF